MQEEVVTLLEKGAIEPVPESEEGTGFYSTFFVVPKKPEGLRPILNLKQFNHSVVRKGFRLDSIRSIKNEIRPGDLAVSVDLKDAYYHVPVAPSFKQYLRFCFKGQHFQFRALPFGLSSSPRAFCKCLAPILASCHAQGHRVLAYLDDWLVLNPRQDQLNHQCSQLIQLLESLGWLVSYKKSQLTPSHRFVFLGVQFDTIQNHMAPSLARIDNLVSMAVEMLNRHTAPAVWFLEILGHMASVMDILPTTRFHMRTIQMCLLHQWKPKRDHVRTNLWIYQAARSDLAWWGDRRNLERGSSIWPPDPNITVVTDASMSGWGAHCEDKTAQGVWSLQETSLHINVLEMKTVLLALQVWIN